MLSGYLFRAYPTLTQTTHLRRWIGHQRFIKNSKVRERDALYADFKEGKLSEIPAPNQKYAQFHSEETAWLSDVPSQILRNGAYRFAIAHTRFRKGLGGAPSVQKKHGRQSVLVTSELFTFTTEVDPETGKVAHALTLGSKTQPLGRLHFKAHRDFTPPKMLSISVAPSGKWFVSFCSEAPSLEGAPDVLRTPEELAYEFGLRDDLNNVTVGVDRGVAVSAATSSGATFHACDVNQKRINKRERRAQRYQRKMARQVKGSVNRRKTKQRIARLKEYGANARLDFAHKTSATLVKSAEVLVFEDLKVQNMTATPAPRPGGAGRYARNGAAAKAGLNKALLQSSWGRTLEFARYKAARMNKLVLTVPAAYSSQECSRCGHVHKDNRVSQSLFTCVACGHTENADVNAAKVIKKRGVTLLKEKKMPSKKKKTARVTKDPSRKIKVGVGFPEPDVSPKPVESVLDVRGSLAACGAVLYEAGNPRLPAQAGSGG